MNARVFPGPAWVLLAATLAIGAAACGPGSLDKAGNPLPNKPLVLTLADGEVDISNAQPFANAVQTLSRGALQIKIERDWGPSDPNYEPDLIKYVQAGKAQLGIAGTRAFDTVGIHRFQALQAPFMIDNYPLERKVLDSAIPSKMLAALPPHGLVGLAVLPGPLRRPLGFTRPLLAAASYRRARIAIRPSRVSADIFRALGAIPVNFYRTPGGGSIAGLTGMENHAAGIDSGAAVPHAVLTGNVVFEPRPSVIFMNSRAFALLTARQRSILYRAVAQARAAAIWQGNDKASAADICRRGIKIVSASPADLAGLQAAVRPVDQALESDPMTRVFIDEIIAMRRAVGGTPDTVTCPAASAGGTATGASALQGTWQVTYTERELAAAGADSGELLPSEGNWGHFTFTLRHGHWSQRLLGGGPVAAPNNLLPYYGTYVVTGDKITFYRHDHDYVGSDTEVWGPYIWSVYRETLTFKRDGWTAGSQGPTELVVKPWHNTGT
jgi:TRAP-type C4-dicarboxylate transport system substrate-binding protein